MNEFSLINTYFNWQTQHTTLSTGDDAAIIDVPAGYQLVSSSDTLIAGVHFLADTDPTDIAYKALAVNLSDLAAMGASPRWFSLALTLPTLDKQWLSAFSNSLKQLANTFKIDLIGGDTTKGKLSISIHILGVVPSNQALLRSGAKVGDVIYISNTLGCAALAWQQYQQNQQDIDKTLLNALHRPNPQVALGQSLRNVASACVDISDGLLADLGHILTQSQVSAVIDLNTLPLSALVRQYIEQTKDWCIAVAGGDDYELCFSVPKKNIHKITALTPQYQLTKIGYITDGSGLEVIGSDIKNCRTYQHF